MILPSARYCGDCTLCCKVMEIETLNKPVDAWCPHCRPKRGCAIYDDRPAECDNFNCLWLVNERLDERWKPSKAKFVLTTSEDGIEVRSRLSRCLAQGALCERDPAMGRQRREP